MQSEDTRPYESRYPPRVEAALRLAIYAVATIYLVVSLFELATGGGHHH